MAAYKIQKEANGRYFLAGELTFSSVDKKIMKSFNFIKSKKKCCINLEYVNLLDSAGLALIVEIIKLAEKHNTELTFDNIPKQLSALSKLSGFNVPEFKE